VVATHESGPLIAKKLKS